MSAEDVQIDWEARCGQLVTESIRSAARASAKLRTALLERDQARLRVRELEEQVRLMTPAAEKLAASERAREQELVQASAKVREANEQAREARRTLGQGQRAVLESVITSLQSQVDRLPPSPVRLP